MNSGRGCIAGTRLLVPERPIGEAHEPAMRAFHVMAVGPAHDQRVNIGPLVTRKQ